MKNIHTPPPLLSLLLNKKGFERIYYHNVNIWGNDLSEKCTAEGVF